MPAVAIAVAVYLPVSVCVGHDRNRTKTAEPIEMVDSRGPLYHVGLRSRERHLGWFILFCRAHGRDQHTDHVTATPSVATDHICVMHARLPNKN